MSVILVLFFLNAFVFVLMIIIFPQYSHQQIHQDLPPQDYPEWMLLLGFACCVAFLVAGLPGNIITILALARCKKVIVAIIVIGQYHTSLLPHGLGIMFLLLPSSLLSSHRARAAIILQRMNVKSMAMQLQLDRFITRINRRIYSSEATSPDLVHARR